MPFPYWTLLSIAQVLSLPSLDSAAGGGGRQSTSSRGEQQPGIPPAPRWVVLDGAHTPESAAALRSTLRQVFPDLPLVLVLAMASDKEHRAVVDELRACSPRAVVFTTAAIAGGSERTCAPGERGGF